MNGTVNKPNNIKLWLTHSTKHQTKEWMESTCCNYLLMILCDVLLTLIFGDFDIWVTLIVWVIWLGYFAWSFGYFEMLSEMLDDHTFFFTHIVWYVCFILGNMLVGFICWVKVLVIVRLFLYFGWYIVWGGDSLRVSYVGPHVGW